MRYSHRAPVLRVLSRRAVPRTTPAYLGQTPHQAERLRELLQAVGARLRLSLPMAQPTMFPRVELVQVMPALQRRRPQRRHQQDLRARGRQPARAVLRVELAVGVRGHGAMELSPRPSL